MTVETLYTAVANTPLFPALVGGAALTLAIGDRLNLIDNIAGVTALVGVCVTVELEEA
ncbi:MAG: hypothetical protein KKB38_20895 [Gammaproteobacteria bacterium]|nr:hypothetical protein [Gammaproteobacteria bacterium]